MALGLGQPKFLGNSTTFKVDDCLKCGFPKWSVVSLSQKKTFWTLQCSSVDFPVPKGERKVHTPKVWFDQNGYIVRRIALVDENGFVVRRIYLDDDEPWKVAGIHDEVSRKLSLVARIFKFFQASAMEISVVSDKAIRLIEKDGFSLVQSFRILMLLVYLALHIFRCLGFKLSWLLDFKFFQAEVAQRIEVNLQNLPPNRYAVLVAAPSTHYSFDFGKHIVGAVEIIVQKDDVLQHLPEAEEYVYILGNVVLKNFRIYKVATILLKACDELAKRWGFKYLVVKAGHDDFDLYLDAGYEVIPCDPLSRNAKKNEVLMVKRI